MQITLYKSALCPRCYLAKKHLLALIGDNPNITFSEVDILTAPAKCLQDGIKMIPALKVNGDILSSIYLTRNNIQSFLAKHDRSLL